LIRLRVATAGYDVLVLLPEASSVGITVDRYETALAESWDSLVENSNGGTIFHRLEFLQYHGQRFRQHEHQLGWHKGQTLFGIMPMAVFVEEGRLVARSPYGASYGGPVFQRPLSYSESQQVVGSLMEYFAGLEIAACKLTLPIPCCYDKYSETFRLVLLEYGFRCTNRDISSVVCLDTDHPVSETMTSRARNMARKARKLGVSYTHRGNVLDFWAVMERTFEKHGTSPTHTLEEFQWLCDHLSGRVYVDVAYLDEVPVAGIGFFVINRRVDSSFYLCQDPEFQSTQALSLLIYEALSRCQEGGYSWFDFGTSSIHMQGRENLFRFKESFGAVGWFRDTYFWEAK
jgi:hypothetical protein